MDHPFFAEINWVDLINKKMTGSYLVEPPRYSIQDFVDEFKESTLTPS